MPGHAADLDSLRKEVTRLTGEHATLTEKLATLTTEHATCTKTLEVELRAGPLDKIAEMSKVSRDFVYLAITVSTSTVVVLLVRQFVHRPTRLAA